MNFLNLLSDVPKYNIDLKPLEYDLPYHEILKHFKENNKFLFEMTIEEKELNDKIKAFNYVNINETETENININTVKKILEDETNRNKNSDVNNSKITNSFNDMEINSTKRIGANL